MPESPSFFSAFSRCFALFSLLVVALLAGCRSSTTPNPADDNAQIDRAIAQVKSDPKMTEAQKKNSIQNLEAMRPANTK